MGLYVLVIPWEVKYNFKGDNTVQARESLPMKRSVKRFI